jgi:hypothetical protein
VAWIRLLTFVAFFASPGGSATSLDLPPSLRALLATGTWDRTLPGFRVVALSFLADGCVAEARRDPAKKAAALACVERCWDLAMRLPGHARPLDRADGLFLTHESLILGAAHTLGPCPDPARHAQMARALAQRSLADPHRHAASYAGRLPRWPADQSATLASLVRYDRGHDDHLHESPLREWRAHMLANAMDTKLGLPWSEVTGQTRTGRLPRGCALSFQTRFLAEVDAQLAQRWWQSYRSQYVVTSIGLAGLREWPPGQDHAADVDSGPIIKGVGAAATGLGIAAARVMGDEDLARRFERTALLVDPVSDQSRYLGAQIAP